jgi:long-chain acyl-CoA synthetase
VRDGHEEEEASSSRVTEFDGLTAWSSYPGVTAGISRDSRLGVYTYPSSERPAHLWALFERSARRFPYRPALIGARHRTVSYAELLRQTLALAAAWRRQGVRAGERVALLAANGIPFVKAFLAVQRLGAVAVCLNTKLAPPEIAWQVADCAARAVVYEREFEEKAMAAAVAVRWEADGLPEADPATLAPGPDCGEHDPAVILYTSGTTGRPKGAVLTHSNLIHSAISYARCFGLDERDRTLIAVPIFHVTGLAAQLLTLLRVGGACVLLPRFSASEALSWLDRECVTHTLSVPTIYALLLQEPGHDELRLPAWRIAAYGGAPMPRATAAAIHAWLPHLDRRNTYGLTEVASPATIMPPDPAFSHPEAVGLPVPVGECRVVDPVTLRPNPVGELWVRGPMVTPGYWNRPQATAAALSDGWLRTGDIAAIGPQGHVRLLDRIKDMINRGGEKVYSIEVEDALVSHPDVVEAAVVGLPDRIYGERVAAFLVVRAGRDPSVESLQRYVGQRLARYKVPASITFMSSLPRNANGKVEKTELRAAAGAAGVDI